MQKTTFNHLSRDLWNSDRVDLKKVCGHPGPIDFQKRINYYFKNNNLLLEMLCHSSFANEFGLKSYERLEFLGDTVLAILVSGELFSQFPELSEGELSKLRGALVNESILAELAAHIDLGSVILLGKGEAGGSSKTALLADIFESMLGAVYLDGGFKSVHLLFMSIISSFDEQNKPSYFSKDRLDSFDPKSRLQELTMSQYKVLPRYEVEESDEIFTVSLYINEKFIDKLSGPSKKKTTKELAQRVLQEKSYAY